MTSLELPYPQLPIKQETESKRVKRDKGPEQKPKKANSEMRKQQNRIASRNYREKRKRKLQYLQRLLKDESANEQIQGSESPQPSESYLSSTSVDYEYSDFAPSPSMDPVDIEPVSVYPNNIVVPTGSSAGTLESQSVPLTQPYQEYHWHPSLYNAAPDFDISAWSTLTWTYNTPYQTPHGASQLDPFTYPTPNPSIPTHLPAHPLPSPQPPQPLSSNHSYFSLPPSEPSSRHQDYAPFPPYHAYGAQDSGVRMHGYRQAIYTPQTA